MILNIASIIRCSDSKKLLVLSGQTGELLLSRQPTEELNNGLLMLYLYFNSYSSSVGCRDNNNSFTLLGQPFILTVGTYICSVCSQYSILICCHHLPATYTSSLEIGKNRQCSGLVLFGFYDYQSSVRVLGIVRF